MRWLAVTIVFLAGTAALLGGVYTRDRVGNPPLPHQESVAHNEAAAVLAAIAGSDCQPCGVALLSQPRHGHWLARIATKESVQCVDINLQAFTWEQGHGFSGVTAVSCARAQSDASLPN
ncbi:MAG: hypothetical protein ACRDPM_17940 [Solirubrobacteraceae bacterium]